MYQCDHGCLSPGSSLQSLEVLTRMSYAMVDFGRCDNHGSISAIRDPQFLTRGSIKMFLA